jgi:hypothetical protein
MVFLVCSGIIMSSVAGEGNIRARGGGSGFSLGRHVISSHLSQKFEVCYNLSVIMTLIRLRIKDSGPTGLEPLRTKMNLAFQGVGRR